MSEIHDWESIIQGELDVRASNAEKRTVEDRNRGGAWSWLRKGKKSVNNMEGDRANPSKNFRK